MSQSRLLAYKDLKDFGLRYSRSHVYRLMRAGTFPKPIHLSEGAIAWLKEEIEAWIQERIDASRNQPHQGN